MTQISKVLGLSPIIWHRSLSIIHKQNEHSLNAATNLDLVIHNVIILVYYLHRDQELR